MFKHRSNAFPGFSRTNSGELVGRRPLARVTVGPRLYTVIGVIAPQGE